MHPLHGIFTLVSLDLADLPRNRTTHMSEPQSPLSDIDRMMQEAGLYETQGLFDHAALVYQSILNKTPDNRKAQAKLVQLQFNQQMAESSDFYATSPEELSPRLALDLGLAYMGMNLYSEALKEFRKPLRSSPTIKNELLRYAAVCLIRLHQFDDAKKVADRLLSDAGLTAEEKGDIIEETVGVFLEEGQLNLALTLLEGLSDDQRRLVKDYDQIMERLSSPTARQRFEVEILDTDTGETYTERIGLDPSEWEDLKATQEIRQDSESVLAAQDRPANSHNQTNRPQDLFSTLEERVVRSMEAEFLSETPFDDLTVFSDREPAKEDWSRSTAEKPSETFPRVRFACECGQVHVLLTRNVGRKGKCGNCGRILEVPLTDTRADSLAETVVGKIVGGCRILHKIGGGGMGGVFKAYHTALDIPVAVKILHSHLAEKDPIFIKRFIREARAAAKLQHPNIVGVMNVGFEDGLHFLVMPYVGGGSAASMLAKVGRFPAERVLRIGMEIARALTVAEEHNILHRDVKPANILFTTRGEAMLADLGLAKSYMESQDSGITQTGIACGTPLYFSPEQAKGAAKLDIRSDIYSLGITLYHLINGSPPFKGESAYVIFQKHVHESLPPFTNFKPPIPDAVFRLLQKMTAKKPDDRFATAQELLTALDNLRVELARADEQPPAKPPRKGLLERLGIRRSS